MTGYINCFDSIKTISLKVSDEKTFKTIYCNIREN